MTRYDAGHRLLDDIEKHNERALAKHEMQVRLLCGYRDQLEDSLDIAMEMLAKSDGCSKDWAADQVDQVYEARQAARKAAVGA